VALEDYTQVIALGPTCTISFQLKRGALARAVPLSICSGPFDWMGVPALSSVHHVFSTNFGEYFDGRACRIELGSERDCWTVVDGSGVVSCHHLRRHPGEVRYSSAAWNMFRAWVDERVTRLLYTLSQAGERALFIRGQDPAAPDREDELSALVRVIAGRAKNASLEVVSVAFGEEAAVRLGPQLRRVFVRPSWPRDIPISEVDWNFDYGNGPAWRGVNQDWDRVFSEV
jgi:hypothetical protein